MTDLLVLGGGPAGIAAAREGRRLGASVVLVERAAPGGTCTHAGCIPAAAFHRTAALLDDLERAGRAGVRAPEAAVDWEQMLDWVGRNVRRAARQVGSGAGRPWLFSGDCCLAAASTRRGGIGDSTLAWTRGLSLDHEAPLD